MSRFQIRFNTKYLESSNPSLKWRLLVDGVEHLASRIQIDVPCETTEDRVTEGGQENIQKWHISGNGKPVWTGTDVRIVKV